MFSDSSLPYISEMPRDETQNLPYIVEIWLGCWWLETATYDRGSRRWSPFL